MLGDVKTIHGLSSHYLSARARDEQSGAVRDREASVAADYRRHAQRLDAELSGTPVHVLGPVGRRLAEFGATRGLVFGHYSEASDDVHDLIDVATDELARRVWRQMGARSQAEARGILVARARRRMGVAAARAFARHRLARVPYIGMPRAAVVALMAQRERERGGLQPQREPVVDLGVAYEAHQALRAGAVGVAA